jgi:phosphonoacetaldehyde hydrolase
LETLGRNISMTDRLNSIKAVVLDWAGTTIDHGSRAPTAVFQEIFRQRGVPITAAQARGPMGMAKREHIAAITANLQVDQAWSAKFGRSCSDADIDAMYADFLPLQKSVLLSHCEMIPGVVAAVDELRRLGLKIGSSTGYTRELMEVVTAAAKPQGYAPDCVICAEDAIRGRPAPYLIYEAARRLDVYPLWEIVIADDTPVGIAAGRNAGCWTIGVTRTGNCLGLSAEAVDQLPVSERERQCREAAAQLRAAGAHCIIESVADIVPAIREFDRRAEAGEKPY